MTGYAEALTRRSKKLGLVGLGSLATATAVIGFGSGTAHADINEIAPSPTVTASQSQNSVIRINDYGVARGISEARLADAGEVSAQGDVRDTVKAVVGGKASAYEGEYPVGPPIADW
ncbi:MAG: hypothetical protein SW019_16020 [Actinomycetota bacterium]|nr:hypothetical protein [Actinomycetota bacterium]